MQSGKIEIGDEIIITGKTTGIIHQKIESLFVDEKPASKAKKGEVITIKVNEKIKKNDKLYVVKDRKEMQGTFGKNSNNTKWLKLFIIEKIALDAIHVLNLILKTGKCVQKTEKLT